MHEIINASTASRQNKRRAHFYFFKEIITTGLDLCELIAGHRLTLKDERMSPSFALTGPRPIISAWWGKTERKTQGLRFYWQKQYCPSSSPLRENRHFVNPAALDATDTEACPGLCNRSLLCQQQGNKLAKLQIRLSREMTSRHNKVVTAAAT